MVENHSNHQGTLIKFPYAQPSEIVPTFPFAELQTPKILPKIHLQHKIGISEKNDPRTWFDLPLNFEYTQESPRSLWSSSAQSLRPESIKHENAMTVGEFSSFGSQIGRSHWDNQDKDCFRNSKRQKSWDPEKKSPDDVEAMSRRISTTNSHHSIATYINYQGSRDSGYAGDRTLWILIYLCFLSPVITLTVSLYTILMTPILLILSPLSACSPFTPLSTHITIFLFPLLKIQLRLIASAIDRSEIATANHSMLILVHIFSPVYALGIALSAWVAALFWLYAAALGDPDGQDRRDGHDDGKAAVLGVRAWWERWLEFGLRFEQEE